MAIEDTNKEISPIYALRYYAWAVLKTNMPDVWTEANYDGLVPIVPLAEEPDLAEFSGPKIVYEYTMLDRGDEPWCGKGSFTMAVMDTNFRRLTTSLNVLDAAFSRMDESAHDIDKYMSTTPLADQIAFGYTTVGFVDGGTPEANEGGNQIGVINVRFEYYSNYNVITDVSPPGTLPLEV